MIATLVTFDLGNDFDAETVRQNALIARSKFENMPGLRSKAFSIDVDKKQARNFYIWEGEAAARNFFSSRAGRAHALHVLPQLAALPAHTKARVS